MKIWQSIKIWSKNTIVQSVFFILAAGLVLALSSNLISKYFGHYIDEVMPYLHGQLWLIFLAYFIYMILQAVIFFLPVTPADVILFAIAGPWWVFALNLVGTTIAYMISYIIARKFGRKLLKKILPKKAYDRVNHLSQNMSWQHFFVISAIPINQPDVMPFVAGLTKIKFKTAIGILFIVVAVRLAFILFVLQKFWIVNH